MMRQVLGWTLATHGQYSKPVVDRNPVLTTHTDYVNKYPSVLQTSSYNFTATATTEEFCAGVAKAHKPTRYFQKIQHNTTLT